MKAIALYSGGLDSTLAIALIEKLGINVQPIIFTSPFGDRKGQAGWQQKKDLVKKEFNKELLAIPFDDDLIELVKSPRFGWGKHLNPCIDCHLTMLKKSKALLRELQADFVVTGEVLGQRPMSQNQSALELIDKRCGLDGLLVRPLSAKCLTPTKPELEGWIDREQLLGIQGRSRKPQMALAKEWNVTHYQPPAGGCLLTDESFSKKVRDLLDSDMLDSKNVSWLQPGRYFKLGDHCKLMVARNEKECSRLEELVQPNDVVLKPDMLAGPTAVMRGNDCQTYLQQAVDIVGYYTKKNVSCDILVIQKGQEKPSVAKSQLIEESIIQSFLVN